MNLIFAQGNPGEQYAKTRHNVGFAILDKFAKNIDAQWHDKSKFNAMVAEIVVGKEKVILAKPTTFYNETGASARALVDFYNLDIKQDLLVVYDELDLPFGTVRTRVRGSDAGNNGVKSLNQHLGPDFHRIRVGVSNDMRDRMDASDFVLSSFNREESTKLKEVIIPHVLEMVGSFVSKKLDITSKTLSN